MDWNVYSSVLLQRLQKTFSLSNTSKLRVQNRLWTANNFKTNKLLFIILRNLIFLKFPFSNSCWLSLTNLKFLRFPFSNSCQLPLSDIQIFRFLLTLEQNHPVKTMCHLIHSLSTSARDQIKGISNMKISLEK